MSVAYSPKLKRYNKKLTYSYSFGIYPTMDMVMSIPDRVIKVLFRGDDDEREGVQQLRELCVKNNIPMENNPNAIERIAYRDNTYAVGIFEKYESLLKEDTDHVVLVNPRNMGNMGTMIRTMIAFGLHDLAIIRPGVDIFAPKVVRAAMGGLFKMRFRYFGKFNDYQKLYPEHHYYPFLLHTSRDIRQVGIERPYTLIFGNEGAGLPDEFRMIGQPVFIPQNDEVDSLNLSIAAGVAMWHFCSLSGQIKQN